MDEMSNFAVLYSIEIKVYSSLIYHI